MKELTNALMYRPIAIFHSSHHQTYEAPRQGVLAEEATGWFELNDQFSKDSIEDLIGFERIWLIYDFHQNKNWKPKVRPPRFSEKKRSVFSTRSPYRPNNIGMSCVKLQKIEDKKVFVTGHDILDGSPILDIKPYLPYADSFPNAETGWVKTDDGYLVEFESKALEKILWLEKNTEISFKQTILNQLAYEPTNGRTKRVKSLEEHHVFSIRTWRFSFRIEKKTIEIFEVSSGYSRVELRDALDPYNDKELHSMFLSKFNL